MATMRTRDPAKLLARRALLVGLVLLLAISLPPLWGVFEKERESASLRREAESRLQDLTARNATLGDDVAALHTRQGREAQLRAQYAVGEEGEHLIVIVDQAPQIVEHATTTLERIASWLSFW